MPRSIYSEELAESVLALIREGKTMKAACEDLDINVSVIYGWKGRNHDQFADRYYQALQDRALAWADQILTIADDCPPREIDVKRAALQIRARQWLIEKQAPTVFAPARTNVEEEAVPLESPMDFLKTWKRKQIESA